MVKIINRKNKSMGGGSKRDTSLIKNIAIHYSATNGGDSASFENYWKNEHGWNTGGYHEVILQNGVVELNYNANVISNGVGGLNTQMYNICYVGDGIPNNEQMKTLINRVNKVRKKYNIPINNIKGHREYRGQSTNCPKLNMNNFRNKLRGKSRKPNKTTKNKTIEQLANEVIQGKHGTGNTRKKSLGSKYRKVQKRVNELLTDNNNSVNYGKLVQDTLKGKYGNGAKRKQLLGRHYNVVQKRINRL